MWNLLIRKGHSIIDWPSDNDLGKAVAEFGSVQETKRRRSDESQKDSENNGAEIEEGISI